MGLDYSFDRRIARQYDRQRAHPPAVSTAIGSTLSGIVGDAGKLLEIGIGTGRIALPAAAAGCQVTGFDLSNEMLLEIDCTTVNADATHLHLCQADMHELPFADQTFDAVLAVHVLHLAKDVERVLHEAVRVLKPGGCFLRGNDWLAPDSVVNQFRNQLRMFVMNARPDMKPPGAGKDLDAILRALGGSTSETKNVTEWTTYAVPAEVLTSIANRTHSESWVLPDHMLEPAVAEIGRWAGETWPNLEAEQPVLHRFELTITRGAWRT